MSAPSLPGRPRVVVGTMALLSLLLWGCLHTMPRASGGPDSVAVASPAGLSGADIDMLERMDRAYERIATSVRPAIVNIQTTQVVKQTPLMPFNDPFFRQFFGQMDVPRSRREHALGSGVIVTSDGYIVTNNHVIEQASDVQVLLPDNRQFKAKVVGTDPQTDVALIKINAGNLPTAPLGDSSTVKVGDTVMAFGNPFGLNFSISRGSVNAVGRSGLNIEHYESFIQTDAPINPGNSGGALVNIRGQVIGINTAILSNGGGMGSQGGFQGIGFAIPSNSVKSIMGSLMKTGKVVRGYMGVRLEQLTSALSQQFGVPDISGALVTDVEPGSPAEKAGLKSGDIIRTFNGQAVDTPSTLQYAVAGSPPGTNATLGVWRDRKLTSVNITLGELPSRTASTGRGPHGAFGQAPATAENGALRGVAVQDLTPSVRQQLGLPAGQPGVVVAQVAPDSPAGQVLQPGDVILSINRQPVRTVDDYNRLASAASGQTLLQVEHEGATLFVVVSPDGSVQGGE